MGRHDLAMEAHKELEGLDILNSQLGFLGEADEELVLNSIEGQTNIIELLDRLMIRSRELKADAERNDSLAKFYVRRKERLLKHHETLNALFEVVLDRVGLPSIPGPYGTIVRRRNPKNILVVNEAALPSEFWKSEVEVKIDRATLKKVYLGLLEMREEAIAQARLPYADQIAAIAAMPEGADRAAAQALLDGKLAPEMARIDIEYPLPDGVEVAPTTYSAFVK